MFTVIGITEPQFLEMYPELGSTLEKLHGKIRFCGRVSHAESISALMRADYTIIIRNRSRKNMAGFPTKFVEAVTCGINIIANDFSDVVEYFPKDGKSYLIDGNGAFCIFDRLKEILSFNLQQIRQGKDLKNLFDYKNEVTYFREFID